MKRVFKDVTARPADPFDARKVISYRAVGPEGRGRLAVEMELRNRGTVTWTPTGAALVGAKREELTGLTLWPVEPIPPGKSLRIVVELAATEREARGTYTLKLWAGEAGAGGVNVDGVTFPYSGGPDECSPAVTYANIRRLPPHLTLANTSNSNVLLSSSAQSTRGVLSFSASFLAAAWGATLTSCAPVWGALPVAGAQHRALRPNP